MTEQQQRERMKERACMQWDLHDGALTLTHTHFEVRRISFAGFTRWHDYCGSYVSSFDVCWHLQTQSCSSSLTTNDERATNERPTGHR